MELGYCIGSFQLLVTLTAMPNALEQIDHAYSTVEYSVRYVNVNSLSQLTTPCKLTFLLRGSSHPVSRRAVVDHNA
jgi:hypothetical protein